MNVDLIRWLTEEDPSQLFFDTFKPSARDVAFRDYVDSLILEALSLHRELYIAAAEAWAPVGFLVLDTWYGAAISWRVRSSFLGQEWIKTSFIEEGQEISDVVECLLHNALEVVEAECLSW